MTRNGNKTVLTTCIACRKPGVRYFYNRKGKRYAYYIHYNEKPIGRKFRHGKPIDLKYRTCYVNGRVYNNLEDILIVRK